MLQVFSACELSLQAKMNNIKTHLFHIHEYHPGRYLLKATSNAILLIFLQSLFCFPKCYYLLLNAICKPAIFAYLSAVFAHQHLQVRAAFCLFLFFVILCCVLKEKKAYLLLKQCWWMHFHLCWWKRWYQAILLGMQRCVTV